MSHYRNLALLAILIYATIYSTIIPLTNDVYSYTTIIQNNSQYPLLFPTLVKITLLLTPINETSIFIATFLLGSVIILVILPYFLFEFFVAYTKNQKIAFIGLFAYLFGTGITNYYYYSNIYSQALATSILLVMMICLMRKQWIPAVACLILIALSHRLIIFYALILFFYYLVQLRREVNQIPAAYCLYKSGEISFSSLCLIPFFLVVYPIFWIFTLRNVSFKTINDKLFSIAAIIPLFFIFYDFRTLLMSFTFFSLLIGKEAAKGQKRLALIIVLCAAFSIFSYFYMHDLIST